MMLRKEIKPRYQQYFILQFIALLHHIHRSSEEVNSVYAYLFLLSVILAFEVVHAVFSVHGEIPQRAFTKRGHLLLHLHGLKV